VNKHMKYWWWYICFWLFLAQQLILTSTNLSMRLCHKCSKYLLFFRKYFNVFSYIFFNPAKERMKEAQVINIQLRWFYWLIHDGYACMTNIKKIFNSLNMCLEHVFCHYLVEWWRSPRKFISFLFSGLLYWGGNWNAKTLIWGIFSIFMFAN